MLSHPQVYDAIGEQYRQQRVPDRRIAREIRTALGGWRGLGALATACVVGVWLGFSPPASWLDPASVVLQSQDSHGLFQSEDYAVLFSLEDG